jgi:hypothetical protein
MSIRKYQENSKSGYSRECVGWVSLFLCALSNALMFLSVSSTYQYFITIMATVIIMKKKKKLGVTTP